MKKSKVLLVVVFILSLFSSAASRAEEARDGFSVEARQALAAALEKCLVRPYGIRNDGTRVTGAYRSICEGTVRDGFMARVSLATDGSRASAYEVRLSESENSDGGDLWDVAVWDENAHLVLELRDVLAFGDPFEALVRITGAGPEARIHDESLDERG